MEKKSNGKNLNNTENSEIKQKKRGRGAPPEFLFKKGQSGNPEGRPAGSFSLLTLLKQKLQEIPEEYKEDKKTYADLIVERMLADSIKKGDQQQIKLIWNYIEGMPTQKIAGADGHPLQIIIKRA